MTQDTANSSQDTITKTSEVDHKRIAELIRKAEAAYNKQNYQWAAELYCEIYTINRKEQIEYLQKMILSSLGYKNLSPNKLMLEIKSFFSNLPFYFQVMKTKDAAGNPEPLYEVYEQIIKNDPDSSFALLGLSKIYEKHNLTENAAILLDQYIRTHKNNVEILKKIGDLYVSVDNGSKARTAFKKVLEIKPFEQYAEKRLRDILALTSIDESKLRGQGYQDSIKDKTSMYKSQIEMKVNRTEKEIAFLIEEKKKEIAREPSNIPLKYDLLNYYRENNDQKSALSVLEDISVYAMGDINLQLEKMELQEKIFEEESVINAQRYRDEEHRKKELYLYKKSLYMGFLEAFPTSTEIKFKLAKIYFSLNENDEALKLYQVCSKIQELAVDSMNRMGLIFVRKQMFDMAIMQFKNAAALLKHMDDQKKDVLYNLACAFESNGQMEEALIHFKSIYQEDVSYRDIAEKIEKTYKR